MYLKLDQIKKPSLEGGQSSSMAVVHRVSRVTGRLAQRVTSLSTFPGSIPDPAVGFSGV